VPFADPSMAEIHKEHKSDSDPLEPRVTRSKSRSLNIDDLIKGTEVNTSSSDSEFDAEPCSDAPRGLVTAVNKKRKRPRVKFKTKTLDPSLPPTPTNIPLAVNPKSIYSDSVMQRISQKAIVSSGSRTASF
jgi:hypothetical protein